MQGAFFATPIMYAFTQITDKSLLAGKILISNPVAQIMQDSRYMLITPATTTTNDVFSGPWFRLIPLAIVAATSFVAIVYFKRRSRHFAEEV